jgi:oligogalacturonide lyase
MKMHVLSLVLTLACTSMVFAQGTPNAPGGAPGEGRAGGRGARGGTAQATQPPAPAAESLRKEWVDPDTGHRVFRLSTENGAGSLYFHYNAYSADGKKVVFNSPSGIMAADLATKKAELVVPGRFSAMETSRTSNEVYYIDRQANAVMAADLDTKAARKVVDIPQGLNIACVNADGTLFAGVITNAPPPPGAYVAKPDRIPGDQFEKMFPGKKPEELTTEQRMSAEKENRLAGQLRQAVTAENPRCLFTLNAKTGEVKKFGYAYAWLNHLQFSPTDPNLMMFCHEGTWHEVDRIWTIPVNKGDGVQPTLMHKRTMDMEIWGHEGFTPDGKSIFYDLQTPRSVQFWLVVQDLATLKETRYALDKNEWGIHFYISKDGKMAASDGSDPGQVAFAPDGMWINLFYLQPEGKLKREKVVNMSKHNYVTAASGGINGVEPNVTFSPDGKFLIFTGTFDGARHVYAAETAKAQ